MHGELEDLRLLHLARGIEAMLEGLERAFERHLPAGAVRASLEPLFRGGAAHDELDAAYDALNQRVKSLEGTVAPDDLLQALLACERTAEGFYTRNSAHLHDAGLVDLFRRLASEEASHARAVEAAIRMQADGVR